MRFNKGYKQRAYLFIGAGTMILILAVYLAFVPTFQTIYEHFNLQNNIKNLANNPRQLTGLRQMSDHYNNMVFEGGSSEFERALFTLISDISKENKTVLTAFHTSSRKTLNEWTIITTTSALGGGYVDVVKSIFAIENELAGGRISGVDFFLERDRVTRRDKLTTQLYIQSIVYEKN